MTTTKMDFAQVVERTPYSVGVQLDQAHMFPMTAVGVQALRLTIQRQRQRVDDLSADHRRALDDSNDPADASPEETGQQYGLAYSRLLELEQAAEQVVTVSPDGLDDQGGAALGAVLELQPDKGAAMRVILVSPLEAECRRAAFPKSRLLPVSAESPMGMVLQGIRQGDRFSIPLERRADREMVVVSIGTEQD